MRAPAVIVVSLVACAFGAAALVACADLFHGTDDILNACEIDASVEACAPDAATDAQDGDVHIQPDASPFILCLGDSTAALARAQTACRWLGACESPMGTNRYAACMVHALETYDCNIAKNRTVKGDARTFWTCLAQVDGCDAVDRCTFPIAGEACGDSGVTFTACGRANKETRGFCRGFEALRGEPCVATGQVCANPGSGSFCLGGLADGGGCTPGCNGTALDDCDEAGVNVGVDCKFFGGQSCTTAGGFAACRAELGATRSADSTISCNNGVATGAPSGIEETVNCSLLTGNVGVSACDPNAAGAAWDVSRACFSSSPCNADSCSGSTLSSCIGGVTYTTTCGAPFTGCSTTPATPDGPYARCVVAGR